MNEKEKAAETFWLVERTGGKSDWCGQDVDGRLLWWAGGSRWLTDVNEVPSEYRFASVRDARYAMATDGRDDFWIENMARVAEHLMLKPAKPAEVSKPPARGAGDLEFGDRCLIEQHRFEVENEMFEHKVIGRFKSNKWVEVPVRSPAREVIHSHSEQVVSCVTVGVDETKVLTYRVDDCQPLPRLNAQSKTLADLVTAIEQAEKETGRYFPRQNLLKRAKAAAKGEAGEQQ